MFVAPRAHERDPLRCEVCKVYWSKDADGLRLRQGTICCRNAQACESRVEFSRVLDALIGRRAA